MKVGDIKKRCVEASAWKLIPKFLSHNVFYKTETSDQKN
jgi:hypothetical protein